MQFLNHRRDYRRSAIIGALFLGLVFVFNGCARSPKIIDPSKRGGFELGEFKRYELNMERDFWHHCRPCGRFKRGPPAFGVSSD